MPATASPVLDADVIRRYSRHLLLPEVGVAGQARLADARVLLVGVGGLGSPLALYLAAAGVGTLGLVDPDVVDESNLQRQVVYRTGDVGRAKVRAARDHLAALNPLVRVVAHEARFAPDNACDIAGEYDVIVDGADNFATRYLTNDTCVRLGRPNVHGSVYRFEGQASVFAAADGPCYRCVYPVPPPPELVPSCADAGVLGVLPGLVGVVQATETLKLLLGVGEPLVGRLLLIDALGMAFRTVRLRRDPACVACGTREFTPIPDYDALCAGPSAGGSDAIAELTPCELAARLGAGEVDLVDVREPHEWTIARIAGARLVPLSELAEAIPTLDRGRDVVVHCKGGTRSAAAVRQLRAAGFTRVWNLAGGITRWSDDVDPTVPKY